MSFIENTQNLKQQSGITTKPTEPQKKDIAQVIKSGDKNALDVFFKQSRDELDAFREQVSIKIELLEAVEKVHDNNVEDIKTLLKESRAVNNSLGATRKATTDGFRDIIDGLLEYEKDVRGTLEKDIESVKKLLNAYKAEKEAEAEAERQRIQREKDREIEMTRISKTLELAHMESSERAAIKYKDGLQRAFDSLTLENFSERVKNMKSLRPKLSLGAYEADLNIHYNNSLISNEEFSALKEKAHFYKEANDKFKGEVESFLFNLTKALPQKKKELEQLAELAKKDKAVAEAKRKEAARQAEERQKQIEAEREKAKAEREKVEAAALEAAKLNAELNAQAAAQTLKSAGKVKMTAVIGMTADHGEIFKQARLNGWHSKTYMKVLQAAADHLANGAKPEIDNVQYKPA